MQFHDFLTVIVLLLLHPLICFTASSSAPSSPTNKANKHELETAIKNRKKAERKFNFDLSNLDDAMNNEVFMGHTGHEKWVHLAGERKKHEAEAKVNHLASKLVFRDHKILPHIFHGRAIDFNKKAARIQSEMDATKANSKYDQDVFDKNLDEHYKKLQDHEHAIAECDKIIHKHSH